jgi:MtrB/PioB family decaheme-associated outer membrane protein
MMKTTTQKFGSSQKIIALAILGIFGSANAADDDIAQFTKPESSVSVGATGVSGDSKDRSIFGQYNGMREHNAYLNLDVDYLKRDDATGTWMTLEGRNLGLDNRELSVSMQKQGDWKVTGDASELVKRDLRTINTADTGVGSTTPTVIRLATPGTGRDVNLDLKRVGLGLGVEKWLTPYLQFEASFKNEKKDGSRIWGRGYDCASYVCAQGALPASAVKNAILLTAEPVDSTTRQFEAKFNFHDEKLNLSGAYYGSFYENDHGNLTPTVPNVLNNGRNVAGTLYGAVTGAVIAGGGTSLQNVLQSPMALPPDNQAHQFSLSGNYSFTPTTKATFKYSYTHATQDQSFASMGLSGAPAGRSNLGGEINTQLAQFGLTAKPIQNLSLLANLRYEKKDDNTPLALYNVEPRQITTGPSTYSITPPPGISSAQWDNGLMSNTKYSGKLEASYQLPENFRATVGVDYNSIERLVPSALTEEVLAGLSPMREKTHETGYRLELRRSMSETLTGAVSYSHSKRDGSDWTSLSQLQVPSANIGLTAAQIAANTVLINRYCGGVTCYGQGMSDNSILGISPSTPFAMSMANLERDKWKLSTNWTPMENLSLQFVAESGKDDNTSAVAPMAGPGKGWRSNETSLYSIDVDYAIDDNWKLTSYYSHGDQHLWINHSTGYMAELTDKNDVFGFGLRGKPTSQLEVGVNLTYQNDSNEYGIKASPVTAVAASASAANPNGLYTTNTAANFAQAAVGLPNVTFRQTTLSLFGKYALDKASEIRVNFVHQDSMLKEWTWRNNGVPFTYADNTTVSLKQNQSVNSIGAAYVYKFQ